MQGCFRRVQVRGGGNAGGMADAAGKSLHLSGRCHLLNDVLDA